jgi:hypothetical protein
LVVGVVPSGLDEDVRRLDVTVDDAVLVRVLNRAAHGHEQLESLAHGHA